MNIRLEQYRNYVIKSRQTRGREGERAPWVVLCSEWSVVFLPFKLSNCHNDPSISSVEVVRPLWCRLRLPGHGFRTSVLRSQVNALKPTLRRCPRVHHLPDLACASLLSLSLGSLTNNYSVDVAVFQISNYWHHIYDELTIGEIPINLNIICFYHCNESENPPSFIASLQLAERRRF